MTPFHGNMLVPGAVVAGRYRIEALIGRGGFGAVFRATQQNLGRAVALKVLLPELVQAEGLQRFKREAELAQRLEHPNTVRLLDFGQADDGVPFIAFELLKGQPLDAVIKLDGSLPPARVARIASQVLKSLMEAHALGIVHRDIKPANVFLCEFQGESDFVKVLDFGIAKAPAVPGSDAPGVTRFGQVVGTPNYMAPEQVMGKALTPATDQYALGLLMSEALTGDVIVKGTSGMEICMLQASDEPVPHPPRALQSPLGPVIHRATQKDAQRRYASAGEMLQHLEAIMRAPSAGAASGERGSAPGGGYPSAPRQGYGGGAPQQGYGGGAPQQGHGGSAPQHGYGAGAPQQGYGGAPHQGHGGGAPHPGYAPTNVFGAHAPVAFAAAPPAPMLPPPVPAYGYGRAAGAPGSSGLGFGQGCLIAGGIALLLGIVGAAVAAFSLADRLNDPTASRPDPQESPAPAEGRAFRDLTASALRDRIESAGYNVIGDTRSQQSGVTFIQYTVQKSSQAGAVVLYKYDSASTAEIMEGALKKSDSGAIAREGGTVLYVMIATSKGGAASRELLDRITR